MDSDADWKSSGEDSEFNRTSRRSARRPKRRKLTQQGRAKTTKTGTKVETPEPSVQPFSIRPLLEALRERTAADWDSVDDIRDSFETVIEALLPAYEDAEKAFLRAKGQLDETSTNLLPLSREEARRVRESVASDAQSSILMLLLAAKSRLQPHALRKLVLDHVPSYERNQTLTPLPTPRTASNVNPQVLNALYAIKTTPYDNSFLSRLQGSSTDRQEGVIAVDWETRAPWMELMSDVREHHALAHSEREQAVESEAPIVHCTLRPYHLPQIHDILARAFWEGADVSDALDYSPEKCTVVATYKKLVVGAAFLSSPQETYITYLAVRAGWDNSQIATSMLYHLIMRNPHKDITLHVSINNPAMLLYNRFGFKAEEFIVGFYEDYLDANSPQSKNAFRLRLRR
ncbi:Cysteine-rich protein 2-binding protein [Trametes pubescens]|uniref:Cysteine-rich protein 2-binding protein n=1 Tax=Trametes pubescens TaxID=154538 RepID=A0A1M2VUE1_TRAPU|nr:Cysteine-rich protein 2-binding protein [Trametes pubescens]